MIDISKIKNLKNKKDDVNTSFVEGMPSFYIEPYVDEKEDGKRNKLYFNEEAMNLMGLYQQKDNKVIDKLVFIKEYKYDSKRYLPVFVTTTEESIEAGVMYTANKFSKSVKTIVSKKVYEELVSFYSLDKNQHHTFVLERSSEAKEEDVYFIHVHDFKLNLGKDVQVSTLEEEKQD